MGFAGEARPPPSDGRLRAHAVVLDRRDGKHHGQHHPRRAGPALRHTGVARILADELEARLVEGAHQDRRFPSEVGPDGHRRQLVDMAELPDLQPGRRSSRQVLIEEGAKLLKAKAADCTARNGRVHAARRP